jgi:ubiquinone/menaquinone biosynthesis C-methylase UbiE
MLPQGLKPWYSAIRCYSYIIFVHHDGLQNPSCVFKNLIRNLIKKFEKKYFKALIWKFKKNFKMITPEKVDRNSKNFDLYEGLDYERFWAPSQRQTLDDHERILINELLPSKGELIIDVGCGFGRLFNCYHDRFEHAVLLDGSMSLLRQAYERTGGIAMYVACDVNHIPFQASSFDTVLMVRVFHHLIDSRSCLEELNRVLSHTGCLIFNYNNKQNFKRMLKWIINRRENNPFCTTPDGIGSTFISHHPKMVDMMLRESGFSNIKYYGLGVIDRVVDLIKMRNNQGELAKFLAPILARSYLAPWIMCKSTAEHRLPMNNFKEISELLQCPACYGRLAQDSDAFHCTDCKNNYPIVDGIMDFRVP